MNERLLQFIWQFQYFNRQELFTVQGDSLLIERPGTWNHHQGPDFSSAAIRIGITRWAGNIELHLRSSDWYKHGHGKDNYYNNIILHVVWEDDAVVLDSNDNQVPTLILAPRVPKILLERYAQMMGTLVAVPCQSFLPALGELGWSAWKERLAAERLERRSAHILELLKHQNNHWEEVYWQKMAGSFGIRVNTAVFELVAASLPVTLLAKHRNQLLQLEALLLGQANLLSGKFHDDYGLRLQLEYRFLKKKYGLIQVSRQPAFLRMRPAGFPTIRLAQLAMLVYTGASQFVYITEVTSLPEIVKHFAVTASEYWNGHYRFDEPAVIKPKHLGRDMAENILINTVIPMLFAYGFHKGEELYKDRAIQWLYQLPAEYNQITKGWMASGVSNRCALDSQALIELTNHYCINRRCLDCAVGNRILNSGTL